MLIDNIHKIYKIAEKKCKIDIHSHDWYKWVSENGQSYLMKDDKILINDLQNIFKGVIKMENQEKQNLESKLDLLVSKMITILECLLDEIKNEMKSFDSKEDDKTCDYTAETVTVPINENKKQETTKDENCNKVVFKDFNKFYKEMDAIRETCLLKKKAAKIIFQDFKNDKEKYASINKSLVMLVDEYLEENKDII